MCFHAAYEMMGTLREELTAQILEAAERELQYKPHLRSMPDYNLIHTLSAVITIQDYLAGKITEANSFDNFELDIKN